METKVKVKIRSVTEVAWKLKDAGKVYSFDAIAVVGDEVIMSIKGLTVRSAGIFMPKRTQGKGAGKKWVEMGSLGPGFAYQIYKELEKNPLTNAVLPDTIVEAVKHCSFSTKEDGEYAKDWCPLIQEFFDDEE